MEYMRSFHSEMMQGEENIPHFPARGEGNQSRNMSSCQSKGYVCVAKIIDGHVWGNVVRDNIEFGKLMDGGFDLGIGINPEVHLTKGGDFAISLSRLNGQMFYCCLKYRDDFWRREDYLLP